MSSRVIYLYSIYLRYGVCSVYCLLCICCIFAVEQVPFALSIFIKINEHLGLFSHSFESSIERKIDILLCNIKRLFLSSKKDSQPWMVDDLFLLMLFYSNFFLLLFLCDVCLPKNLFCFYFMEVYVFEQSSQFFSRLRWFCYSRIIVHDRQRRRRRRQNKTTHS